MSNALPILGHERALTHLRETNAQGRLHHAYLFEGPEGVGKLRVARWLALMCNCEAADPADRPCGQCNTCITIAGGSHPDVSVVVPDPTKATKSIPVARIREVIRTTGFHRYGSRRRFVIIDPAESMAPAAANALLKTLEEPPDGTGFVLLTTHADVLLPTVLSRCQRIRFGPVALDALVPWLRERGVEDADAAARISGGCPGRALALAEGELAQRQALRDELLATLGGDLGGIFGWTESLTKGSRAAWRSRVELVLELLEDLLRDATVCAQGGERELLHADIPTVTAAWSKALWPGGVRACNQAIEDCRDDLRVNVTGRTALDALLTVFATQLGKARKVSGR